MADGEQTLVSLERRLDELERRTVAEVASLRTAIAELRRLEPEPEPEPEPGPVFADFAPARRGHTEPRPKPLAPEPDPVRATVPPPTLREPGWFDRIDWAAYLTGPRGLALAGGVVSLLGIVFLFVLAVDRGWVTPWMRVGVGAAVSIALFGAATEIMRRYGQLYAATAAVAAAIGGSYATLYAATAMYHFLPASAALLVVAAIAATSVLLSARWDSEFVAGLGLISATFAPAAVQHEVTFVGLLFAAVVFGTSGGLLSTRGWQTLTAVCWAATGMLTIFFLLDGDGSPSEDLLTAGVFGALYLVTASIEQLRRNEERVGPLSVSMPLGTVLLELVAVHQAWGLEGVRPGLTFLGMASACVGLATLWFRRPTGRTMAAVVWAVALVFAGTGAAALLDGASLTLTWALEAAALFSLAVVVKEIRLQLAAVAYAVLAAGHGLVLDVPPWQLFLYHHHPARGIAGPTVLVAALAFGAAVLLTRTAARDGATTRIERFLASRERLAGEALAWAALALGAYVGIALILQVAQWLSGTESSFEWAQATSTGFVAGVGTTILVIGSRRPYRAQLWLFGLGWLAAALVKLTGLDPHLLDEGHLTLAQSLVAAIVLLGGYVAARVGVNEARHAIYGLMPISAVIATTAIDDSLGGDPRGYAFACLAAAYAGLTAASFVGPRDRNLVSLLTAPAAIFGATSAAILVESWWLVAVLAAAGAALMLLARTVAEPRFQLFGLGFLAGTVGLEFRFAPPSHLVSAVYHPAAGIVAVAAAVALLALSAAVAAAQPARDDLDRLYADFVLRIRRLLTWCAAGLALYGVSLLVLELFQHVGGDSVHTGFQRGETAVSGLWAVVGLTLLCVGLFGRRKPVRIGGLTLLGVALVKLFVFDLSNLSSISRALSFLVVGAALLGGGFVYQKLSAELHGLNDGRLNDGARPA